MIANITVFAMAYLLFHVQGGGGDPLSDSLGPADAPVFRVRRPDPHAGREDKISFHTSGEKAALPH